MTSWQRKRKPDDVPTPIAVALSDYCRRAGTAPSAPEVRAALSLLGEDEDFRVRELTDAEPKHKPLGPFAVIDLVRGTEAVLASQRQQTGYYDVVRELLTVQDSKVVEIEVPAAETFIRREAESAYEKPSTRREKKQASSIAEKIAPKKRGAPAQAPEDRPSEAASDLEEPPGEEPQLLPFQERQQSLPKPRGRFSRLEAIRGRFDDLFRTTSKPLLEALIDAQHNRRGLLRALSEQFGGRRGLMNSPELLEVIQFHKLEGRLEALERTQVLSALSEHRGAMGRVSWSLGMSVSELEVLIKEAKLTGEVEEVRERFRREALSPKNFTQRLDLLGREKYLIDLGIKKRFSESLTKDLRMIFRESATPGQPLTRAVDEVARKQGAPTELLQRAVEKLGLAPEIERHLQGEPTQRA